jgi:hypothetical protein
MRLENFRFTTDPYKTGSHQRFKDSKFQVCATSKSKFSNNSAAGSESMAQTETFGMFK